MAGIFDQMAKQDREVQIEEPELPTDSWDETDAANVTDRDDACLEPISDTADENRTPHRIREAIQELLKHGLLEENHKPNLYRVALTNSEVVRTILEPLDLAMGIDTVRGLVFVIIRPGESAEQDDWSHPLIRRQRLNLEQSLLIAILRQHFIAYEQESGVGANQAQVALDDLIPQLQVYLGDLGSDARERTRITNLLDQLKGHGLVSPLDAHDRVIIRPIIAHLANPENLQALLVWLRDHKERSDTLDNTHKQIETGGVE